MGELREISLLALHEIAHRMMVGLNTPFDGVYVMRRNNRSWVVGFRKPTDYNWERAAFEPGRGLVEIYKLDERYRVQSFEGTTGNFSYFYTPLEALTEAARHVVRQDAVRRLTDRRAANE